jgi:DNA ligase 1
MWDGRGKLISRGGIPFQAPKDFTNQLPRGVILDGELWIDRGMFSDTVSVLRTRKSDWGGLIQYKVFDGWDKKNIKNMVYLDRLRWLKTFPIDLVDWWVLDGEVECELSKIISLGGEGLIIRDPSSLYSPGRQSPMKSSILKLKPCLDAEARILAVELSPGRKGSVLVKDSLGCEFRISAGFKDTRTVPPPSVGAVITFSYSERHPDTGIPKHARFVRVREDVDWT